jgi:hypothetical protein
MRLELLVVADVGDAVLLYAPAFQTKFTVPIFRI